jgi:hypothetical protein
MYGTTEVCWRVSGLHGLYRRTGIGLFMGAVAPDANNLWIPEVKLGSGFTTSGCQTSIEPITLRPIEAHPGHYFLGIADVQYAVAAGGQL